MVALLNLFNLRFLMREAFVDFLDPGVGHLLADRAREDVGQAARCKSDQHAHRLQRSAHWRASGRR